MIFVKRKINEQYLYIEIVNISIFIWERERECRGELHFGLCRFVWFACHTGVTLAHSQAIGTHVQMQGILLQNWNLMSLWWNGFCTKHYEIRFIVTKWYVTFEKTFKSAASHPWGWDRHHNTNTAHNSVPCDGSSVGILIGPIASQSINQ